MAGGVLVGVDGSEPSLLALDWAAEEARARGEPLTVLCVANDDVLAEPALWTTPQLIREHAAGVAERAGERARRAAPGLEVSARVLVGVALEELEKASSATDLLVLGSRGLGAFSGMLIGSVSDRVARRAACPVVVVRGDSTAADRPVLLGVDGAPESAAAADFAFAAAERRAVPVIALTAAPPAWGGSPDRPLPASAGGVGSVLHQMQERALRPQRAASRRAGRAPDGPRCGRRGAHLGERGLRSGRSRLPRPQWPARRPHRLGQRPRAAARALSGRGVRG